MTAISLWMQEPGGSGIIKSWVSQRDSKLYPKEWTLDLT